MVSPRLVLTSFHGNDDTVTDFEALLPNGDRKIIKLHRQEFVPNRVDIALFRLRDDETSFVHWVALADQLPEVPQIHDMSKQVYV